MNNGGEYGKVDFLSLSLKAPVDFHCRKHKFMGANRFLKKKQITLDYFIMVIVICRKLISFIDLSQSSYKSQCKNRCISY